jgi:hypothetical protein
MPRKNKEGIKTIGFEIAEDFPLSGAELKAILKQIGTIFILAVQENETFVWWRQLPQNVALIENLEKLLKWSGIPHEQSGQETDDEE